MDRPSGFWASLWSFICFLPFFVGLLLLGIIKGALICPIACLITTIGNSAVVLGLWPAHAIWTFYSLARSKMLGPILKVVLFVVVAVLLIVWPCVAIVASVLGGALYGFLAPLVATFEAVGGGKTNEFVHCLVDGMWTTIKGTFTVVRDFTDVCFHSYFSLAHDLRLQEAPDGKRHEIRVVLLFGSFFVGLLGILVDIPAVTIVALFKSPIMLYRGWQQLIHDLIGREGPFLETACVPFAGLAVLLWPLAVIGGFIASLLSAFFLGGYAAVVSYQESSLKMGMSYIFSSVAIYDEYTNDVLGLHEGSCFPRHKFRKNKPLRSGSISRLTSLHSEKQDQPPPSRTTSFKDAILEIKPIKLLEHLFRECGRYGEKLVAQGLITEQDIEDCIDNRDRGGKIISIGLPAYAIFQALLRSLQSGSDGILLSDETEITSKNRPRDTFFDWFFDPLMILKEQIKADDLSREEEQLLEKLVLLQGDPERRKDLNDNPIVKNDDHRRAKLDALARRLRGITKSISRYPTAKRRFDSLAMSLSEELRGKLGKSESGGSGTGAMARSRSAIAGFFSQKSISLGRRMSSNGGSLRAIDVDIENGSS